MRIRSTLTLAGITASMFLGGCSGNEASQSAVALKKPPVKVRKQVNPAERSPDDMVAAVSAVKSEPSAQVKYELRQRPEVGQPLEIDIAVVPVAPALERVQVRFQAGDGLTLVDGAELAPVEKPALGTPIRHVLKVLPQRDGIFVLTAAVQAELSNRALDQSYSIPLIAGQGLPERAVKADPKQIR